MRSIATALGGHCTALRRTAVGPFAVEEADPDRLIPVADALGRLDGAAVARVPQEVRSRVIEVEAGQSAGLLAAATEPAR